MVTTAKLIILSVYLIYMTNLYRSNSLVEPAIKTISAVAHAIVIGSISLLIRKLIG